MSRSSFLAVLVPCLLALTALSAHAQAPIGAARQRPFSEWVASQGTVLRPDGRPILFGWTDNPITTLVQIDFTGKLGAWVSSHGGPSIETSLQGTLTERTLDDGSAELLANVHFKNAMTFAQQAAGFVLGYPAQQLAADASLQPGLADGVLQVRLRLPYAGAPIPDLVLVDEYESLAIRATGFGPLRAAFGVPEGSPGMCVVSQTGLFHVPGGGATGDGYPAEVCRVQALGEGALIAGSARSGAAAAAAPPSRTRSTWGRIKSLYR